MMNMESSIQELKGIGEKTVLVFQKAGIRTIDDLLNYYPRNYDTYDNIVKVSEISDDDVSAAVYGTVVQTLDVKRVRRLQITNTVIRDDSGGMIRLIWFNMPYLKNTLKRGSKYIFRGKISRKEQQLLMEQPAVFRRPIPGNAPCDAANLYLSAQAYQQYDYQSCAPGTSSARGVP